MNKKERIRAALNFQPVDRLPYALWAHMPGDDLDPVRFSKITYDFHKKYDTDFIKIMNNGMYATEDFGCVADYSEILGGGAAKLVKTPISTPADWAKLTKPDVHKGAYGRELETLKRILEYTQGEVPVLFTIFSPLTIVNKIALKTAVQQIQDGYGRYIHEALKVITETTEELADAVIRTGADGIFFATQLASYDLTTEALYAEYGKAYDIPVIEAANAAGGWFNLTHVHGENIQFDLVKDYPTQAFNWHVFESLPELSEARALTGKCLVGGIRRYDITNRKKNEIRNSIYTCIKELGGRGHILTPGCTVRYPLDPETFAYIREIKEELEAKLLKPQETEVTE